MNLKRLLTDENAVTPVIGIILMVAITVILAAVIGTFVLGVGETQNKGPTATFDYSNNTHALNITHTAGDDLDSNQIELRGPAMSANTRVTAVSDSPPDPWTATGTATVFDASGGASTGNLKDGANRNAETLYVVWVDPKGEDTEMIAEYTFPA